jgi:hypothetical protein
MRNADMIGKVCRCSKGIVGVILGRKKLEWGESWVGLKLDGGNGLWASRSPTVVAKNIYEYYLSVEKGAH